MESKRLRHFKTRRHHYVALRTTCSTCYGLMGNLPYIDVKPARRIRLRLPPDEDKFLASILTKDKRFTSCHLMTFFKSQLYPTTRMKGY